MTDQIEISGGGLRARPRFLSLDLSLSSTGYCLDGEPGLIVSGDRGMRRIDEIVSAVMRYAFGMDLVVIEGYAVYSDPRKYRGIAERHELAGCVKLELWRSGTPYVMVPPSTLKLFVTGYGKAPKHAMLNAAIRRFHLGESHSQEDEVDAYLLWCAARQAYGGPVAKISAAQAKCLKKVPWPELPTRGGA